MNMWMRPAKPGPDLQAGGKQRDRTKKNVGDQQRIVAGMRRQRLDSSLCRIERQVGRDRVPMKITVSSARGTTQARRSSGFRTERDDRQ
jgi:hypothetical protein